MRHSIPIEVSSASIREMYAMSDGHHAEFKVSDQWTQHASCRPDLLPPLDLMRREHIEILEDWYTWSVERVVLLR